LSAIGLHDLTVAVEGTKAVILWNLHRAIPQTLTRLFISAIRAEVELPTIPTLHTLLLARTTIIRSGLELGVLFPCLRVFAWDNVAYPFAFFVFPTFPPTIKHVRLVLKPGLDPDDVLKLITGLPAESATLNIHLVSPLLNPLPARLEGAVDWLNTSEVRWTRSYETQQDVELWEAGL
jgi:hypothetical protein